MEVPAVHKPTPSDAAHNQPLPPSPPKSGVAEPAESLELAQRVRSIRQNDAE